MIIFSLTGINILRIFFISNKNEIRIGDLGLATVITKNYTSSVLGIFHLLSFYKYFLYILYFL